MKTAQISQNQLLLYLTLYFYSTIVGFGSGQLIQLSQYDTLLVQCIGGVVGGIYAFFIIKLANRRPNEFFIHYGKDIVPPWIHWLIMGLFFFSFLYISASILKEYENFIVQTYLSETPSWAIGILFGFVVAVTARAGIVTLFRTAQGLFFLVIISNLTYTIFIGRELKLDRWMAFITNHSGRGILTGSFAIIPFFCEIFLLLFIFPYFTQKNKTFKTVSWGIFLSLLILISNTAFLLFLFGPNLASHLTYPMLEMVRYIRIADFIENLDPLLIAIWSTTVFLKLTLTFYISALILTHLFRLKDQRPFTFSLAAVMVALSLQMSEHTEALSNFFSKPKTLFSLSLEAIPLLYLLIDTIQRYYKEKSVK